MQIGRLSFFFTVLMLLLSTLSAGSSPEHRLYTTEDGLPSTFVKHVQQLPSGLIVISTDDGLAFYDGYTFYNRGLQDGLPDSFIKYTLLDDQNRLFVATDNGLAVADLNDHNPPGSFVPIDFHPTDGDRQIRRLHKTTDGRILLAGQNAIYLLNDQLQIRSLSFAFRPVNQNQLVRSYSFEDDHQGGVLIASAGNNLLYLAEGEQSISHIANTGLPNQLRDIRHAGGSMYWVASDFGLYLITWDANLRTVTGQSFIHSTRGTIVDNITIIDDEHIEIGTDGDGLLRISTTDYQITKHRSFFSNFVKHNHIDNSGNQWVSTDHGIAFIPNMPFGNIGPDEGLPRRYVTDVIKDDDGTLWIATYEGFFFRKAGSTNVEKLHYLDQELIYHARLIREQDRIFAFTHEGIHAIDTRTHNGELLRDLGEYAQITNSIAANNRDIWLVTNTGNLILFNPSRNTLEQTGPDQGVDQAISGITRTHDGLVWISGSSGYLAWYHIGNESFVRINWDKFEGSPPDYSIMNYLHPDSDGYLWIGSSEGLYSFDPFASIPSIKKIPTNIGGSIRWIRSNEDNVWIGSNRHLLLLSKCENDEISQNRNFSLANGLVSTSFSHGAASLDSDGHLWMGTNVGVSYYNNGEIISKSSPVRLRYWRVQDTTYTTTEMRRLDSHVRSMSFSFTTLDFPSDDVVFQNRMAGIGEDWSEPTQIPEFTRFFQGSGRYTFEVRASRNSTDWSEPLAISFVILRPWWQGNFMILVYLMLFAGVIFGLVRWNSIRLRIKNKELADGVRKHTHHLKQMVQKLEDEIEQRQQVEEELRETNFTNERMIKIVSHDLRSPFQGIMGFATMLQDEFEELSDEERQEMVAQIINSSNLAVSLLNQLLDWITLQTGKMPYNPVTQKLSETVEDIADLFKSLADSKEIRIETSIPHNIVVFADRNMLQSILRNLVSNALKFTARGGKVIIKAVGKLEHCEISIIDNGVGMDQNTLEKILAKEKTVTTRGTGKESGSGLGLLMTKEMINRHGGVLTGKSMVKRGTTFTITLPNSEDNE